MFLKHPPIEQPICTLVISFVEHILYLVSPCICSGHVGLSVCAISLVCVISMCGGKMPYSNVSFREHWKEIIPKVQGSGCHIYDTRSRIVSTPPINEFPN